MKFTAFLRRRYKPILILVLIIALVTIFILSAYHALRLRVGVWVLNKEIDPQELVNEVKPKFTYLPKGWMPPMKQEMNSIWEPLDLKGMNYFSFGAPKNIFARYVERSNPYSKFYQAWFGVYVIKAKVETSNLARLAEHDQLAWLKTMGDPNPKVTWIGAAPMEKMVIDGSEVNFVEGTIVSHSDLTGVRASRLFDFLGMPPESKWEHELPSYHSITLTGIYGPWYQEEHEVTIVIYGCGSSFKTSSGKTYNHYGQLRDELISMAKGIELVSVAGEKKIAN